MIHVLELGLSMHYFEMSALRRLLAMLDGAKHFRAPVLRSSGARLALPPVSAGLTSPPPSEFILLPPLTAPHGRDSICEVAQTWAAFRPCRIAVPQIRDWGTWGRNQTPQPFLGVGLRAAVCTPQCRNESAASLADPGIHAPEDAKSRLTQFPESIRGN